MPMCYRAKRPLKIGNDKRWPGELVPEAYTWNKVMALVHGGFIEEIAVSDEDLTAALDACSDHGARAHFGLGAPEPQVEDEAFQDDEEAELRQTDLVPVDESEDQLVEDDEPSLIESVVVPTLSWPQLRKEAKRLGLGRDATKADILAVLESEQR